MKAFKSKRPYARNMDLPFPIAQKNCSICCESHSARTAACEACKAHRRATNAKHEAKPEAKAQKKTRHDRRRTTPEGKAHCSLIGAQYRASEKGKESALRRAGKHRGWSLGPGSWLAAYRKMIIDQGGQCSICERGGLFELASVGIDINHVWCVDHCHQTSLVRGLLCRECNLFLGTANDSPKYLERAAAYLNRAAAKARSTAEENESARTGATRTRSETCAVDVDANNSSEKAA